MKIIKNLRIFTMDDNNTFFENGFIKVENGLIKEIGDAGKLTDKDLAEASVSDGNGQICIPGMITTHAHFYGEFARGMSLSEPIRNWQEMLTRMWWKFDKKLDDEMTYYSAMMGLVDGLKYGTTTYYDHQASAYATPLSLDIIEDAVRKMGARAVLSYEVSDRDGLDHRNSGIEENVRFIKKVNSNGDDRVKALFGLHAGYSISQETLEMAAGYGKELDCGYHIHVAEDKADVTESYRLYDMHVVERLYNAGIFNDKSIAAHGVNVTAEEWKLFAKSGITVANNVQSNTNNAVGVCPVVNMMNDGVRVALGGDGYTYDMFTELGFAIIMQRLRESDPRVFSGEQIRKFAFENPGKLFKRISGTEIGVLKEGAAADFVILNYIEPTPIDKNNVLSHMTSAFSGHVKDVYVKGEQVVKDGVTIFADEELIYAKCRENAKRLWNKL